jgi:hypothetical protein
MPYIQDDPSYSQALTINLPGIKDLYHSSNVFVNFVPVALWQDPQGSEAAVLSAITGPHFATDAATIEVDGEEDETVVTKSQQELVAAGTVTQAEISAGANAASTATNVDTTPGTPATGDTSGTTTVGGVVDDTLLYTSLASVAYYVKTVTKQPGVVFPYDVATLAVPNGTTVQDVCDNLGLLVKNCFDPIKVQYPKAFMTCSFRNGKPGGTSQHPKGMACDIQFAGAAKSDYFNIAKWIRDTSGIAYDQLLLEYKTTGTRNPWIHISFNKAGNRGQVFTFMNDKNCKGPGVVGLYDLSNS